MKIVVLDGYTLKHYVFYFIIALCLVGIGLTSKFMGK